MSRLSVFHVVALQSSRFIRMLHHVYPTVKGGNTFYSLLPFIKANFSVDVFIYLKGKTPKLLFSESGYTLQKRLYFHVCNRTKNIFTRNERT